MKKAKILFIVNEHPNEAFSIPVAREAAKRLRKLGHEVVWYKTRLQDTLLGRVLKSPGKRDANELVEKTHVKEAENLHNLIESHEPDATYSFHCTPHSDSFWDPRKVKGTDFHIGKEGEFKVIEVKAHYRKMPKRILEKTKRAREKLSETLDYTHYLERTTSQSLTRQKGLTPEAFGKAIAQSINDSIKKGKKRLEMKVPVKGSIPRAFPKPKSKAKRRRL